MIVCFVVLHIVQLNQPHGQYKPILEQGDVYHFLQNSEQTPSAACEQHSFTTTLCQRYQGFGYPKRLAELG